MACSTRSSKLLNKTPAHSNPELVDNVPDSCDHEKATENVNSPVVDTKSQSGGANSNSKCSPGLTTSSVINEKGPEEFLSNVEVEITEMRYFKNIGKPEASESNKSPDLSVKNSVSELCDNGFSRPRTPSPQNTPLNNAGNSNEIPLPPHKPLSYKDIKYGKVELYAPITGPKIYDVKGNIVTKPIITKNLPEVFIAQPVHGKPESRAQLEEFYEQKLRDYLGYGITDNEFKKQQQDLSPDHIRSGLEFVTPYTYPSQGPVTGDLLSSPQVEGPGQNLCTVKKLKLRKAKDKRNHYPRKLKYRGLRMLPLFAWEDPPESSPTTPEDEIEPGRDLIFRIRVYRPHSYGGIAKSSRHSVYSNDLVALGRQALWRVRDRLECANDASMRLDLSDQPDCFPPHTAKEVFPSGFLFINNVFYVDRRAGCRDLSAPVREWARRRRLGVFPVRDMAARLDEIVVRLGHPEVYVHQGGCEHLFTFSEVRLAGARDPRRAALYPRVTRAATHQAVYCTTCAEFGAKWLVVGCTRVPFDPAFFCDTCFRLYLYDEQGNKIGSFKAYPYRSPSVNLMRPAPACEPADGGTEEIADAPVLLG